jgi:hypothetical protein
MPAIWLPASRARSNAQQREQRQTRAGAR